MSQINAKVYQEDPDTSVVAVGGKQDVSGDINIKSGGKINVETGGKIARTVTRMFNASSGHQGATGATVIANNTGLATVAASQTATTFVIPITGLKVGDKITSFKVVGAIATNTVNACTVDANLRKQTAGATNTDASVGAITQVSTTAATVKLAASKTGLSETVASETHHYVLLTTTTGAAGSVGYAGVEVTVEEA